MKFKWILILMIAMFTVSITTKTANACEIDFEITKGEKDFYKTGDTLVILVKVVLTHRSCPVGMKKTKFNTKGLKVIKSTQWKQLSAMDWERKLMVVVTETKGDKLNLTAIRECDKDGGFGSLKLNVSQ